MITLIYRHSFDLGYLAYQSVGLPNQASNEFGNRIINEIIIKARRSKGQFYSEKYIQNL